MPALRHRRPKSGATVGQGVRGHGKGTLCFPLLPLIGEDSILAAEAAACADRQDKFWPYQDALFARTAEAKSGAFKAGNLKKLAADLGLDTTAFNACLDKHQALDAVRADYEAGQKLGVQGTPTFFINGVAVIGAPPYDQFKQLVEVALKEKQK